MPMMVGCIIRVPHVSWACVVYLLWCAHVKREGDMKKEVKLTGVETLI